MSSRSWKILSAVILVWASALHAQEKPEWQQRLDALKLPPNPKFDAAISRASSKETQCFDQAALKAIAVGRVDKDISEIACKACDGAISEYAAVYLQANAHRYIGMTIDQALSAERDQCRAFKSLRITDLRYEYEHAVVDRVAYGTFGRWSIEERIARNGLLSFVLSSQAETGPVALEMTCYPVDKHVSESILGPFVKSRSGAGDVFVTYARDAEGMKQTVGKIEDGLVRVAGGEGRDSLMSMTSRALKSLRISIQGQAAVFNMEGYTAAFPEWTGKCFK